MQCILVTPEATLFDKPADFVALTLFDGEVGIAPGHAPMIGRLGYGEMRVQAGGKSERYYVEGGFVEVLNDVVSILTGRAVPADKIDTAVAMEQFDSIQNRPAHSPELMAVRDRIVAQSRAQLRVARKER